MKTALIISVLINLIFLVFWLRKWIIGRFQKKDEFLSMSDNINQSGADLFADITKSKQFFREIKREIHPDKFIGKPELQIYAQQKMKEASENQHSFSHLTSIIKEMQAEGFEFSERFMNEFRKH